MKTNMKTSLVLHLLRAIIIPVLVAYPIAIRAQTGNTKYGNFALAHDDTGDNNSAFGDNALTIVTGGSDNTAVGWWALANNKSSENTAVGSGALRWNIFGIDNTATGYEALGENTYDSTTGTWGPQYREWRASTME